MSIAVPHDKMISGLATVIREMLQTILKRVCSGTRQVQKVVFVITEITLFRQWSGVEGIYWTCGYRRRGVGLSIASFLLLLSSSSLSPILLWDVRYAHTFSPYFYSLFRTKHTGGTWKWNRDVDGIIGNIHGDAEFLHNCVFKES